VLTFVLIKAENQGLENFFNAVKGLDPEDLKGSLELKPAQRDIFTSTSIMSWLLGELKAFPASEIFLLSKV
jgi:hypothetical protein